MRRLVVALVAGLAVSAAPALALTPSKAGAYPQHFRHACRPPLKYAAGACVRRCPGGYADRGRHCRFRSKFR